MQMLVSIACEAIYHILTYIYECLWNNSESSTNLLCGPVYLTHELNDLLY